MPVVAAELARQKRHNAIICLGAVIRGETPHFDYVCTQATLGLGAVAREARIPLAFGVLTTDDVGQARARAGDGPDNKGYEAALAVLEMVSVYRRLGAG
jgi:6,7-dimethyl-8-ribityllumazine synthase